MCFNWIDPTATTSRYPEALSIGMIPFVWRDYDINNTYNIDDYQRVSSFGDLKERILQLRDETVFKQTLELVRTNYKQVLLSEDEYYRQFSERMVW